VTLPEAMAIIALLAWVYLLLLHGRFWLCSERLPLSPASDLPRWPAVTAVVPARNEEETIAATVESLLHQDYPRPLSVVLVDDRSTDATRQRAAALAGENVSRLTILAGEPLPAGWSGKLWALQQGIAHATQENPATEFFLLCDADIVHTPDTLRALVGKAESDRRDLVSLMAKLNCETAWERLLIPAFVFFFQMLYPFPRANDPRSGTAAAAGGCVLISRAALEGIGGIGAIRGALIDDCTLAREVKRSGGRLWVGLAEGTRSLRAYGRLEPIWMMVTRSAFTQLRYSALIVLGTVLGMALVFLAPPLLLLGALIQDDARTAALALLTCLLMSAAYLPTIRYYQQRAALALSLPLASLLYLAMTIDSARRHWWGSGSRWKGRDYGPRRVSS